VGGAISSDDRASAPPGPEPVNLAAEYLGLWPSDGPGSPRGAGQTKAGEHPVDVLSGFAGNGSQVVARPGKPIEFVQPHPMTLTVESKRSTDRGRNLEGVGGIVRLRVGDRRHDHRDVAVRAASRGDDNRTRAILGALVGASGLLVAPEEAVADHQARLRGRKGHRGSTPYSAASISAATSSLRSLTTRTSLSRALSFS